MNDECVYLSVVIPVYGAPELVEMLCSRLHKCLERITHNYEIILVFDCSPDDSWEKICKECKRDERVKGIRLSRNFGQHYAITAGLEYAGGKWVIVMDCDLQDQPEEIAKLYAKAKEGYDIVQAQRKDRKDNFVKRLSSVVFHKVFGYLTDTKCDPSIANYGIYSRKAVDGYLAIKDQIRCFPIMISWIGYRSTVIPVEHSERKSGKSSYNFRKLYRFALDTCLSFSDKPLRLTIKIGLTMTLVSFAYATYTLIMSIMGIITVSGYASMMISIWFLGGLIIFVLGILGLYIGKIFDGVKNRPIYFIQELVNIHKGNS